jgi:mannose-6-phosphate isomerase-like protein (cupin superfamily)
MEIADISSGKKWLLGIEDSKCPVEIGYFEIPVDKYHFHEKVYEYYLVFSGQMKMIVNDNEIILDRGKICCIEPGEKHQARKDQRI